MKNLISIVTIFILVFTSVNYCQHEVTPDETESTIPELFDFHDIIYPIWHQAYPEKDYEALRSYAGEINEKAEAIYNAKLPGILRDKKEKWDKGVLEFKNAVKDYTQVAEEKKNEEMLKVAENLHTKYEMLVRIIRPVTKEIDAFHKTLYVVYHQYLPNKNWDAIKNISDELVQKAKGIIESELPERLKDKKEEYVNASDELLKATANLREISKNGSGEDIEKAVENMHTKYQNLEGIFD